MAGIYSQSIYPLLATLIWLVFIYSCLSFQKHLGTERTSLLIPEDISSRLRYGSTSRYNEQYARYKDIKSDRREIQQLIDLIHHERKGYDQEGYISQ